MRVIALLLLLLIICGGYWFAAIMGSIIPSAYWSGFVVGILDTIWTAGYLTTLVIATRMSIV